MLLFAVCSTVLSDSGITKGNGIALCGALLFTLCPHISEVLIWKADYHYLQGFLLILLILFCVQRFIHGQQNKYAIAAGALFFLSSFSLEIFYLSPMFVLTLSLYYRVALGYDKQVFKKALLYFLAPELLIFCMYFVLLYYSYNGLHAHIPSSFVQTHTEYLSKPLKYVFHILFLGRYFPPDLKNRIYDICESVKTLTIFYSLLILVVGFGFFRFKRIGIYGKAMLLLLTWVILTVGFVGSLNFPGAALLVFYDRYTYFTDGFIYTLLALIVGRYVNKHIALGLFCIYAAINVYFTVKVNGYWKHSAYVINRLLSDFPSSGSKTVLLLNNPENLNGVPMIGAEPDGEFKALHKLFTNNSLANTVYDVASYNMITMDDGAHVAVINDSLIRVTLNKWGTWWWYSGHGAKSYENSDYKLNLGDPGHWYELTLRHPANNYLLLYEVGPNWKTVDMSKRNVDQY